MKFGETIGQRSVPKWSAYNLNYNELKRLIKIRTTNGAPSPVPIPGQTNHRWSLLEDELFDILKDQYNNIALFLRSKHGEIQRRLVYLDKSVRSAKRAANLHSGRPSLQARKYQKLAQEAEAIGEDIQALSRFAAVQKTAFRKILKKYRKWTDSESLQARLEHDVFSDGQLDLNLTEQMQHLSAQVAVVKDLESQLVDSQRAGGDGRKASETTRNLESPVTQISRAAQSGPLTFDTAFATVPFGEASGIATYWIHPDNLDEAKVLLLRYTRDVNLQIPLTRDSSTTSLASSATGTSTPKRDETVHTCYLDNVHRFVQDNRVSSPSRIAMCARWSQSKEATVSMADMSPRSDNTTTVKIKRKDLASAIDRDASVPNDRSASAANVRVVKEFLSLHRDVKAIATSKSSRSRYAGITNSLEVGLWATMDSDIVFSLFSSVDLESSGNDSNSNEPFPHTVLQIRWEFGRKPEVVRAFDTTHLAEKAPDFSMESAAVHNQHKNLAKPSWVNMMSKDIRKVPVQSRTSRPRAEVPVGTASGPSSTDGPTDSVFSAPLATSSAGSQSSLMASTRDLSDTPTVRQEHRRSKKARIAAEMPRRDAPRYYSEYDDPESELHQQEAYTIYCDPNEEAPGMATIRKIGSAFGNVASCFVSEKPSSKKSKSVSERTSLLRGYDQTDEENQSSESESDQPDPAAVPQHKGLQGHMRPAERYRIRLSRRQRAFERTLAQFYTGLIVLSYIFLLMSGILLTTGRRKEVLEVDIGATVGVVVAFTCMIISIVLVYMRKQKLGRVERISLVLADGIIVLLGVAAVIGIVQRAQRVKK